MTSLANHLPRQAEPLGTQGFRQYRFAIFPGPFPPTTGRKNTAIPALTGMAEIRN